MLPNGLLVEPSPVPPGATNHSDPEGAGPGPGSPPDPTPRASISVRRLQPSAARWTTTRMRVVVSGAKVIARHTRLLLTITPPGTVCHAEPVQYWTVKSLTPHCDQVMAGVGSLGALQAFWTVKTATSSMVLLPAKVISTQSG